MHHLERVPSGLGVAEGGDRIHPGQTTIGGGELLLPGEITLAEGESYATLWVYLAAARSGLDDLSRPGGARHSQRAGLRCRAGRDRPGDRAPANPDRCRHPRRSALSPPCGRAPAVVTW